MCIRDSYDKLSYRNAYREFQAALSFKPGDRDATQKLNEAYDYAVTNVVILPMQQQGGYVYSSYTVGGDNLDDKLIRNLQYNSGSEFVKFYSAWDARSRNIRVDQELDMRLVTIDIGRYYDSRSTRRAVSYTHLRAHETVLDLVCRLLLEKKQYHIINITYT